MAELGSLDPSLGCGTVREMQPLRNRQAREESLGEVGGEVDENFSVATHWNLISFSARRDCRAPFDAYILEIGRKAIQFK